MLTPVNCKVPAELGGVLGAQVVLAKGAPRAKMAPRTRRPRLYMDLKAIERGGVIMRTEQDQALVYIQHFLSSYQGARVICARGQTEEDNVSVAPKTSDGYCEQCSKCCWCSRIRVIFATTSGTWFETRKYDPRVVEYESSPSTVFMRGRHKWTFYSKEQQL